MMNKQKKMHTRISPDSIWAQLVSVVGYRIILLYELVSKRRISQQEIDLYNLNSFGLSIVDPTHSLIHVIRIE